jgi:hypothetical protein
VGGELWHFLLREGEHVRSELWHFRLTCITPITSIFPPERACITILSSASEDLHVLEVVRAAWKRRTCEQMVLMVVVWCGVVW